MFYKQAFVSTYMCEQTEIDATVGLPIWKEKKVMFAIFLAISVFAAERGCTL